MIMALMFKHLIKIEQYFVLLRFVLTFEGGNLQLDSYYVSLVLL